MTAEMEESYKLDKCDLEYYLGIEALSLIRLCRIELEKLELLMLHGQLARHKVSFC